MPLPKRRHSKTRGRKRRTHSARSAARSSCRTESARTAVTTRAGRSSPSKGPSLKVAVDAMGGDHGPAVVVEGAVAAVREFGASVILVGDRAAIEREVTRLGAQSLGLEVRHASQVVGMGERPSQALRRKRDSSLRVAAELVRDGHASAFISAGNTGAAMAIAMFVIGVLRGIDRPAIATVLPSLKRATLLLDVGANV